VSESSRQAALAVLELSVKAATAYGRPDLAERLDRGSIRLTDPAFHVLVVGEYKQGKSSLVNALLRETVCPVDDDIATAVPTLIGYAAEPTAVVAVESRPTDAEESDAVAEDDTDPDADRIEIPVDEVIRYATADDGQIDGRRVRQVQVGIPHPLLKSGLVVVDTPGVGGLGSTHTTVTIGALPMASAVLFVSDASQEFTAPELDFLRTARSVCPTIIGVMTKTDFYPEWRRVLELDQAHLARAGIEMEVVPVSAAIRQAAIELDNGPLHKESGFPELIDHLQRVVLSDAERLALDAATADMLSVVGQLESQFVSERAALADPEQAQTIVDQLEAAREQADRLRGQAARWQQTLNDGFADLQSDAEHDLRTRLRDLTRAADDAIDAIDPADAWNEFEGWLYRQAGEQIAGNYALIHNGSSEIAARVAEHFNIAGDDIAVNLAVASPGDMIEDARRAVAVEMQQGSRVGAGLSAIRGSYSGILMFGVLGRVMGLGLLNPAAVVVGLLLGGKALRDEKNKALAMRRTQGKNAHRKYTDELAFEVAKDARDTLRRLQRQLRDHFAARADELHRSTIDALANARRAAKGDEVTRAQRLLDVEAELDRLRSLRERIEDLGATTAVAGTRDGSGS
jgi:GTPase SAR1 family protein